jgi:cytochrome bd-type quinol oxidase subunit 2
MKENTFWWIMAVLLGLFFLVGTIDMGAAYVTH